MMERLQQMLQNIWKLFSGKKTRCHMCGEIFDVYDPKSNYINLKCSDGILKLHICENCSILLDDYKKIYKKDLEHGK